MADEDVKITKITIDGEELKIGEGNRVVKRLKNLLAVEREERYAEDRKRFIASVQGPIDEATNGLDAVLSGMTLVYPLDSEEPTLVDSSKVTIKQRASKKKEE